MGMGREETVNVENIRKAPGQTIAAFSATYPNIVGHNMFGHPVSRVLRTCEAARRARHHARRARHARHRNFLNFYIYTFVKVILGNHFLIN